MFGQIQHQMSDSFDKQVALGFFCVAIGLSYALRRSNPHVNADRNTKANNATKEITCRSPSMMVVTRIHTASSSKIADPLAVKSFCESALQYAEMVVVCIGFNSLDVINNLGDNVKYTSNLRNFLEF